MHIDALIHTFRLLDILDIFVVAIGIYYLYKMLKDTRAVALLKGIVFLAIINMISHLFNLYVINWILQQSMTVRYQSCSNLNCAVLLSNSVAAVFSARLKM